MIILLLFFFMNKIYAFFRRDVDCTVVSSDLVTWGFFNKNRNIDTSISFL